MYQRSAILYTYTTLDTPKVLLSKVVITSEHSAYFYCRSMHSCAGGWVWLSTKKFNQSVRLQFTRVAGWRSPAERNWSHQGVEVVYPIEDKCKYWYFLTLHLIMLTTYTYVGVNTHSVVVIDNRYLERDDQQCRFSCQIPSSYLNTIELVFSEVKSFIKADYLVPE